MVDPYDFPVRPSVSQGIESGPYFAFPDEHGDWAIVHWDGAKFWNKEGGKIVTPEIWFGPPALTEDHSAPP